MDDENKTTVSSILKNVGFYDNIQKTKIEISQNERCFT